MGRNRFLTLVVASAVLSACDGDSVAAPEFASFEDLIKGEVQVLPNPSGVAPLTAQVTFATRAPVGVTMTVIGHTGDESLSYGPTEPAEEHEVPILGLYPGAHNLIELRLAILSTRLGLGVPPLPGRDPAPDGSIVRPDDQYARNINKAFARGRNRANKKLAEDADVFMSSLDFWAFLND